MTREHKGSWIPYALRGWADDLFRRRVGSGNPVQQVRSRAWALALALAGCAGSGSQATQDGPHFYCSATTKTGSGPTLVVTEQVFPFDAPAAAFPAAAPELQSGFAAYAATTWAGMAIAPVCRVQNSEQAADAARQAEIGRYEGQGYAIWRVSYWRPG